VEKMASKEAWKRFGRTDSLVLRKLKAISDNAR
jgi:hypothetical protein